MEEEDMEDGMETDWNAWTPRAAMLADVIIGGHHFIVPVRRAATGASAGGGKTGDAPIVAFSHRSI